MRTAPQLTPRSGRTPATHRSTHSELLRFPHRPGVRSRPRGQTAGLPCASPTRCTAPPTAGFRCRWCRSATGRSPSAADGGQPRGRVRGTGDPGPPVAHPVSRCGARQNHHPADVQLPGCEGGAKDFAYRRAGNLNRHFPGESRRQRDRDDRAHDRGGADVAGRPRGRHAFGRLVAALSPLHAGDAGRGRPARPARARAHRRVGRLLEPRHPDRQRKTTTPPAARIARARCSSPASLPVPGR